MLKIGLTGSIAVGKSFVCEVLREQGCHVLDADRTSREVVELGTTGLAEIEREFGSDILLPDGSLDRKAMAAIVFGDNAKRELLNSIVHPRVHAAQERWVRQCETKDPKGIAIIDAALMIESGGYRRFDKLIVVWCEPAIQLKRLMLRDNLSKDDASRRIGAQMPQNEKKRYADFLIDTTHGHDDTRQKTLDLAQTLRELAEPTDDK